MSLGVRLPWVLTSFLPFISHEIVHSFKTGQIMGTESTKPAPKKGLSTMDAEKSNTVKYGNGENMGVW